MLLNMDGFDDDTTPDFYNANPWGETFTDASPAGAFSPSAGAGGSVTANPTPHSTEMSSFRDSAGRSLISTSPVVAPEDTLWQMYLSDSLSDSVHSLDLNILDPDPLDLVYPPLHELVNEGFTELETLAPSPRSSSAYQGDNSDEYAVFPSAMLDLGRPTFSTQSAPPSSLLPPSRDCSPTIVSASTRPRRGLTGWNSSLAPPSPILSSSRGRSSTRPGRGLSGWRGTDHLEPPSIPSFTRSYRQNRLPPSGSTSKSSNSGLTVPDSLSPSLCSTSTGGCSSRNSERLLKRLRQSDESLPIIKRAPKTRRIMAADIDTDDDGVDDGGDSDYTPSRSPSLNPSRSISPTAYSVVLDTETGVRSTLSLVKKMKKGKGKAKGSAALALAVVSEMIRNPSAGRSDTDLTLTRYHGDGITRRKNQPIPLPIPVPNLNKKSRGRKVPHIATDNVITNKKPAKATVKKEEGVEDGDDDEESEFEDQSSSSTRSRKKRTSEKSKTPSLSGENRTFVCDIPGCGKCFVRSEHLKRHVRSIHTHDKRKFLFFLCWNRFFH